MRNIELIELLNYLNLMGYWTHIYTQSGEYRRPENCGDL